MYVLYVFNILLCVCIYVHTYVRSPAQLLTFHGCNLRDACRHEKWFRRFGFGFLQKPSSVMKGFVGSRDVWIVFHVGWHHKDYNHEWFPRPLRNLLLAFHFPLNQPLLAPALRSHTEAALTWRWSTRVRERVRDGTQGWGSHPNVIGCVNCIHSTRHCDVTGWFANIHK